MTSLIFFFICIAALGIYYLLPQKIKNYFLLLFSWGCYFVWNPGFLWLLILLTVMVWAGALFMKKASQTAGRFIIFTESAVLLTVFYLIRSSYLPSKIGISFFMLQAVGYLADVYQGEQAERNFANLALFMDFFPIQLSGPVERGKHFLVQIHKKKQFCFDHVLYGVCLVLWGLFQKMVIADRCAVYVNNIYDRYREYAGWPLLLAVLLFSIQIYADFSGYSDIAAGLAQCFGFHILRNFKKPYFAASIREFWKGWHISLTTWLTDYIYKPLGGSKKGYKRTYLNIFIVFLVSGIWHGSGITFIVWGCLHALYQCAERAVYVNKHAGAFVRKYRLLAKGITFSLVSFAWIFFRSDTVQQAGTIITKIWTGGGDLKPGMVQQAGLDEKDCILLMLSVILCVFMDVFRGKGIYRFFRNRAVFVQWIILYTAVFAVIIFGIYGPEYHQAGFLYSKF